MKDLYPENYKILINESEDDLKKWKHMPCSLIGIINIINSFLTIRFLQKLMPMASNFYFGQP